MHRRFFALVLPVLWSLLVPQPSKVQASPLCFDVPGISSCIEGRFREYWEQNGGLAIFGYPLTTAALHNTDEGTFLTQYFERYRFELHPEVVYPYDVLLGLWVKERLEQNGRDWRSFPREQPIAGCLFFAETGHNICDQESGKGSRATGKAADYRIRH